MELVDAPNSAKDGGDPKDEPGERTRAHNGGRQVQQQKESPGTRSKGKKPRKRGRKAAKYGSDESDSEDSSELDLVDSSSSEEEEVIVEEKQSIVLKVGRFPTIIVGFRIQESHSANLQEKAHDPIQELFQKQGRRIPPHEKRCPFRAA
jgi:hypothetical protein